MVRACVDVRYAAIQELETLFQPTPGSWLSDSELLVWSKMSARSRQRSWLFGRVLAKQLLCERFDLNLVGHPRRITICSLNSQSRGTRPRPTIDGVPMRCSMSISHTERGVLAVVAKDEPTFVGVDLVSQPVELRPGFLRTWFSPNEVSILSRAENRMDSATLWCIKEAVYKACNRGERFAPRQIEVHVDSDQRIRIQYRGTWLHKNMAVRNWTVNRHTAVLVTYAAPDIKAQNSKQPDTLASQMSCVRWPSEAVDSRLSPVRSQQSQTSHCVKFNNRVAAISSSSDRRPRKAIVLSSLQL